MGGVVKLVTIKKHRVLERVTRAHTQVALARMRGRYVGLTRASVRYVERRIRAHSNRPSNKKTCARSEKRNASAPRPSLWTRRTLLLLRAAYCVAISFLLSPLTSLGHRRHTGYAPLGFLLLLLLLLLPFRFLSRQFGARSDS